MGCQLVPRCQLSRLTLHQLAYRLRFMLGLSRLILKNTTNKNIILVGPFWWGPGAMAP